MNSQDIELLKTRWMETLGSPSRFDDPIGDHTVGRGVDDAGLHADEEGRDGLGIVRREQQPRLDREVAVKRLRPGGGDDPRRLDQFLAEARITGLLDHPNVVPVHELRDGDDGQPVLVMKLLTGRTWAETLAGTSPARVHDATQLDRHLEILLDVCNAVAFAHTKNIIHRDLKPANVMLGEFNEVLVMGWGLGVDVSPDQSAPEPIPHVASVTIPMGSPAYMAPELAWADGPRISKRSDVYLLGAILYELLTGQAPHAADSLWMSVLSAVGPGVQSLGDELPAELAATARRALAADPADRHASVPEFAAEIRDYREHRQSLELTRAATRALEVGSEDPDRPYGKLAEAIEGFRQSLILWPANPEAASGLRRARIAQTRAALAADDLELAAEALRAIESPDDESRSLSTNLQTARRRADRARTKARLLAWAVGAVVVSLSVGLYLVDRARKSETEALLVSEQSQREARESHAHTAYSAGQLAARSGRWVQAIAEYEKALEQDHPDPILVRIGIIEAASGMLDHPRVARLLSEIPSDATGPHRAKLDLLRGEILVDRFKTPEKGLDLIRAAIKSGQLDDADQQYGEALLAPTIPDSLTILDRILAAHPSHRLANELMLGLLAGTGQARRCQEFAERLQVVYPKDPQAILAQAAAMSMRGEVEAATDLINSLQESVSEAELKHARQLTRALSFAHYIKELSDSGFGEGLDQAQLSRRSIGFFKKIRPYFDELQKHEEALAAGGYALFRITPSHAQYVRSMFRAVGLEEFLNQGKSPNLLQFITILNAIGKPSIGDLTQALEFHPLDGSSLLLLALDDNPRVDLRRGLELALQSLDLEGLWDHRRMARWASLLNATAWLLHGRATPEDKAFIRKSVEPVLRTMLAQEVLSAQELQTAIYFTTYADLPELTLTLSWDWERREPGNIEALFWRADAHFQRGDLAIARRLLSQVLAREPQHGLGLRLESQLARAEPK
ncbi:MAG: protein kinase [Planctomycetes bacterium]|nr:protein kinase [Planctomycetota bacterium]